MFAVAWVLWMTSTSPQTYIGHQVTVGSVFVPMFGAQDTRTDTRVLVTLLEEADTMHWQMRTCGVEMAPVAGVKSSLPATTLPKLPIEDIRLHRGADGRWHGGWSTRWTEDDLDGDGFPGVSIHIDVPLCAGDVYVATHTRTIAVASRVGRTILGEVAVSMEQRVLGASNMCLRLGPKRQQQRFDGVFKLVSSPGVTRCSDVPDDAWPTVM